MLRAIEQVHTRIDSMKGEIDPKPHLNEIKGSLSKLDFESLSHEFKNSRRISVDIQPIMRELQAVHQIGLDLAPISGQLHDIAREVKAYKSESIDLSQIFNELR